MLRDSRKDDRYFEDYIIYQNKRIQKFRKIIETITEEDLDKRKKCLRMIANFQKDLFSAKYSIGADKKELRRIFDEYIVILNEIKTDEYAEYIDALAIGILLDWDINKIKNVAVDDKIKDGLVKAIVNHGNIKGDKNLNFANYYQIFFYYLLGKKTLLDLVNYMTETWYETNADFSWYDADKSSENIYTGYWCWLAGACLKLKNENAGSGVPYIPSDLI